MPDLNEDQFDYRGQHQQTLDPETSAPMHEIEHVMPDYYSHHEYYHSFVGAKDPTQDQYHRETIRAIDTVRGKPRAPVSAFRAVPSTASNRINRGDWVTPSQTYAKVHGEGNLGGVDYKILHAKVPAEHLRTSGDFAPEFGYGGPGVDAQVFYDRRKGRGRK